VKRVTAPHMSDILAGAYVWLVVECWDSKSGALSLMTSRHRTPRGSWANATLSTVVSA